MMFTSHYPNQAAFFLIYCTMNWSYTPQNDTINLSSWASPMWTLSKPSNINTVLLLIKDACCRQLSHLKNQFAFCTSYSSHVLYEHPNAIPGTCFILKVFYFLCMLIVVILCTTLFASKNWLKKHWFRLKPPVFLIVDIAPEFCFLVRVRQCIYFNGRIRPSFFVQNFKQKYVCPPYGTHGILIFENFWLIIRASGRK